VRTLLDRGYQTVSEIDGGYVSWLNAGYAVAKPASSTPANPSAAPPTPTRLADVYQINVQDAFKLIQNKKNDPNFMIIDVRTADEFKSGHLAGAVNIDYRSPDFKSNIDQLDRHKEYLIYCRSGVRSAGAMQIMLDLGFSRLHNLITGILGWTGEGYPTVQ
jgi:rhodanese-related sulfurtransferase